jgi:putative hydrolase of the HAD superfamily
MRDVTAVLFDLDDTLYPERRFLLSACRAVAVTVEIVRGIPRAEVFAVMQRQIRRHGRARVLQAVCRQFGLDEACVPALLDVMRRHQPDLRLCRHAVALLHDLRAHGIRLAVLTNGRPDVQRRKVAALHLAPLVDAVVYADEHRPGGKPHRAVFVEALRRLDADAAGAVFVGDHPVNDIAGAAAAGLRTVWLSSDGPLLVVPADYVIGHLSDLPCALFTRAENAHAHAC